MENYLNEKLCASCEGKCCKRHPGATFPSDFGNEQSIKTNLAAALASGYWVIDWWEGDPREGKDTIKKAYYIRPRATNDDQEEIFCASYGGQCSFLEEDGCSIPPVNRPQVCRMLEPKTDDNCKLHGGGKREASIEWLQFTTTIQEVAKRK